jgi:uncharacterized protein YqjF (DUF2071 family)
MPEIVRQAPRFLTAGWYHLVMLNYPVQPAALAPYVPVGTEIDFHDGRTYLSVVGFYFCDTRLMGIPVPFHRHFEEVNLRFYVRRQGPEGWRRGVVFVKEIVPKWAVTAVARWVYNENYETCAMTSRVLLPEPELGKAGELEYSWRKGASHNALRAGFEGTPSRPAPGSEEEFITEHYWGYTVQRDGSAIEYEVQHPPWRVWQTTGARLACDVEICYGRHFCAALEREPSSAFVVDGSEVSVYRGAHLATASAAVPEVRSRTPG